MFASCTDTLLGVGSTTQPGHWVGWINGVEEDGFELRGKGTKSKEAYHISTVRIKGSAQIFGRDVEMHG